MSKSVIRSWPEIWELTELLRDAQAEMHKFGLEEIEVRLQVEGTNDWRVWSGDPSFDTDHRGFWGYGIVVEDTDLTELAGEMIGEAQDSHAEYHDGMAECEGDYE